MFIYAGRDTGQLLSDVRDVRGLLLSNRDATPGQLTTAGLLSQKTAELGEKCSSRIQSGWRS